MQGAEVIIVPSVWSIPAMNRWKIQLPARALDNTVFVLGINNVKEGAADVLKMVSPAGDVIAEAPSEEENRTGVRNRSQRDSPGKKKDSLSEGI